MRTVRWTTTLAALLVLASATGAALAEDTADEGARDPKAIAILEKADAATRAVSSVAYDATATPGGAAAANMGPATGRAVLDGAVGGQPRNFYGEVSMEGPNGPVKVSAGGNGDMFFVIDHVTKKAYEDMDPNVMGSLGNALNAVNMIEFVHDTPFSDEINAASVEYRGTTEVGGVECHEIHVTYANFRGLESTWFFGTEDYLPRRRIQMFRNQQGEPGQIDRVITNLRVDPDLPASTFVMTLPEGYERIDDFAP